MRAPEFWRHDGCLARLLAPFAAVYAAGGRMRRRLALPARVPVPIVCVGNLVAGGAGKTPVAASLGRWLRERGRNVHFLAHGYGGHARGPLLVAPERHDVATVGDEALLLARRAPTWVARERAAGAEAAAAAGADIVVMDDGFQNPSIYKDVSLVVVDGTYGFGNGRVIPAGPLREPAAEGLARADAIVLLEPVETDVLRALPASLPRLEARLEPTGAAALAGQSVVAFAGIGRPEKFFATLERIGCRIVARHAFADHHRYRPAEIRRLVAEAEALGAHLVTTAKDGVRLPAESRTRVTILEVELAWRDDAALERVLAPALRRG